MRVDYPRQDHDGLRRYLPSFRQLLALAVGGLLALVVLVGVAYAATPIPSPNELISAQTTIVYFDNGKSEIGRFGEQNRIIVPLDRVPEHVQKAVLAAEDRSSIDRDVRNSVVYSAMSVLLLGAGLIIAVFIQVRVGLRPVYRLEAEVAQVRRGKSERVQEDYPSELKPLADAIGFAGVVPDQRARLLVVTEIFAAESRGEHQPVRRHVVGRGGIAELLGQRGRREGKQLCRRHVGSGQLGHGVFRKIEGVVHGACRLIFNLDSASICLSGAMSPLSREF